MHGSYRDGVGDHSFDPNTEGVTWGESAEVTWTVQNQGSGTALTNWYDTIYLSSDEFFDSSDVYLGRRRVGSESPLGTGESYTVSHIVTISPTVDIGEYYVLVRTDWGQYFYYDNLERESNEDNNVRGVATNLWTRPDLVVTEVNIPETVTWGESTEVTWTVTNQGSKSTRRRNWYDTIYLSSDEFYDILDVYLGRRRVGSESPLGTGESYTVSHNVTISPTVDIGEYYVLVRTDWGQYFYYDNLERESNEDNNVRGVATNLWTRPDLVVTEVNIPETVTWGESTEVTWTVTNQGSKSTRRRNWYDTIYLSSDEFYDILDVYLGRRRVGSESPLGTGESYTASQNVNIPAGGHIGKPYVLVRTDWGQYFYYEFVVGTDAENGVFEGDNEENNQSVFTVRVANPDLVPTILTAPATATSGSTISLGWLVENQGLGAVLGGWTDKVYLSSNQVLDPGDTLLGEFTRAGSLEPGSHYSSLNDLRIPIHVRGSQYLLLVTDTGNIIAEVGAENNNTTTVALEVELTPFADLTVSNVTAPDLTVGDPGRATISWEVSNQGAGNSNTVMGRFTLWAVPFSNTQRQLVYHETTVSTPLTRWEKTVYFNQLTTVPITLILKLLNQFSPLCITDTTG